MPSAIANKLLETGVGNIVPEACRDRSVDWKKGICPITVGQLAARVSYVANKSRFINALFQAIGILPKVLGVCTTRQLSTSRFDSSVGS